MTDVDGSVAVRLGGPPFFAAEALAREGRTAVICTRGGDAELLEPIGRLGLPVVNGPGERTFVSEMTLRHGGERVEAIQALGEGFSVEDLETWLKPALADCGTVVCGAVWRDDFPPEPLRRLAADGKRVFLDGQGWARPSQIGPLVLEGPLDPAAVDGVDVLKLSEIEADVLIGGIDTSAPGRLCVPLIVVTLGERGAVLLSDGRSRQVDVVPVYGLFDTIGAGDAFLALMAAATDAGDDDLKAAQVACNGVSQLLRDRLRARSLAS